MRFTSLQEALAVAADMERLDTQAWRDAVAYVIEHAPPEMQAELDRVRTECFPELKPEYTDEDGNAYFSEEAIKKALGISDEEFDDGVRELLASRTGAKHVTTADKLNRIQ